MTPAARARIEECEACNGTGVDGGECDRCEGTGHVVIECDHGTSRVPQPGHVAVILRALASDLDAVEDCETRAQLALLAYALERDNRELWREARERACQQRSVQRELYAAETDDGEPL